MANTTPSLAPFLGRCSSLLSVAALVMIGSWPAHKLAIFCVGLPVLLLSIILLGERLRHPPPTGGRQPGR
jgi:hypothetical protein